MSAFDLNSFYILKGGAPETSSYDDISKEYGKGFNLGTKFNENYRANSLRNLIAQREQEGISYDRLSNEAAKYDLNTANDMRKERRTSLDYNYKQSVAEFEHWRKQMARRICGRILQIGDTLDLPPEEYYRILQTAAAYVTTYDEALAQWLLGQAQTRRNAYNKLNGTPKEIKPEDLATLKKNILAEADKYGALGNSEKQQQWKNYARCCDAVAARSNKLHIPAIKNDVVTLLLLGGDAQKKKPDGFYTDLANSGKFHLYYEIHSDENTIDKTETAPETTTTTGSPSTETIKTASPSSKKTVPIKNNSENIDSKNDNKINLKSVLRARHNDAPTLDYNLFSEQKENILNSNLSAKEKIKYMNKYEALITADISDLSKTDNNAPGTFSTYTKQIKEAIEELKIQQAEEEAPLQDKIAKVLGLTKKDSDGHSLHDKTTQRGSVYSMVENLSHENYYSACVNAIRSMNPREQVTASDVQGAIDGIPTDGIERIKKIFANAGYRGVIKGFTTTLKEDLIKKVAESLAESAWDIMKNRFDRDMELLTDQGFTETDVIEYYASLMGITRAKFKQMFLNSNPDYRPWRDQK